MNGVKVTDVSVCRTNTEIENRISGSAAPDPNSVSDSTVRSPSSSTAKSFLPADSEITMKSETPSYDSNEGNKPQHHEVQKNQNPGSNADDRVGNENQKDNQGKGQGQGQGQIINKQNLNHNQQRIHFTIGKKRRKSPSTLGNKRSLRQSATQGNVLDNDSAQNNFQSQVMSTTTQGTSGFSSGDSTGSEEDDEGRRKEVIATDEFCNTNYGHLGNASSHLNVQQQQIQQQHHHHQQQNSEEAITPTHPQHHNYQSQSPSKSKTIAGQNGNSNSHMAKAETTIRSATPTQPVSAQPEGWRVKLYRLNADGSWDDCGTGRIVCLISDGKRRSGMGTVGDTSSDLNGSRHGHDHAQSNSSDGKDWGTLEEEIYMALGEPTLCMHAEIPANSQLQHLTALTNKTPKVLLRTRVLLRESYQRQGDNIITWCEPYFLPAHSIDEHMQGHNQSLTSQQANNTDDANCGVDLALSFQDNAGCREIWNKISKMQHKAFELFEAAGGLCIDGGEGGLQIVNQQLTNQRERASSMEEDKDKMMNGGSMMHSDNREVTVGSPVNARVHTPVVHSGGQHLHMSPGNNHHNLWGDSADGVHSNSGIDEIDVDAMEANAAAVSMAAAQAAHYVGGGQIHGKNQMHQSDSMEFNHSPTANVQLSNPPSIDNLEKIADAIAAAQPHQREAIAMLVSQSECAYLKSLLALFPSAEAKNNYNALATLASIIKSIFLFNEPSIIQLVASDGNIFEDCCCCLEYDPDLKEKANHRWFIKDRLRFRTVLRMEDEDLIESIHKAFRVTYIRDTLLRPTMDESSLSTLGSLLTFTHADVVKGVMCAPRNQNAESKDSYLVRILRLLGKEIRDIRGFEWKVTVNKGRPPNTGKNSSKNPVASSVSQQSPKVVEHASTPWQQYLAPQDNSLLSRKMRRRGCLSFLREMFNMVRMSLQQSDKDDFYAMIVLMDVKLKEENCQEQKVAESNGIENNDTVNLLSLLGAVLSDTNADVSERGACLEILSAIAMHEPSLIRKHCLDEFSSSKAANESDQRHKISLNTVVRPEPNEKRQVVFACPPTDLFLSLLYVMATENDAGIILQTCEVIRTLLDTEMMTDSNQLDLGGVIDNEEDVLIGSDTVSLLVGSNPQNGHAGGGCEQNLFAQMFYDHYVPWLVAPFQYTVLVPKSAIPFVLQGEERGERNTLLQFLMKNHQRLKESKISRSGLLKTVSSSAIRLSFSIELLSFCVRAHCYRMRRYLINSKVLINVMKLLNTRSKAVVPSGDRCLKLGALRCLRTIISQKDEFYNRHIIQHNLFTSVFEAFRANPVGDNLVSSAIIEICELIRTDNIKSLIEYIVTKHMRTNSTQFSSTSIDTTIVKPSLSLEDVAMPYVDTLTQLREKYEENISINAVDASSDDRGRRAVMNEKAMEDQRKFREVDQEESYFFDDDDNNLTCNSNGVRQGFR